VWGLESKQMAIAKPMFFLFSIGSQSGNRVYEDLANFGYKLDMESKKISAMCFVFQNLANLGHFSMKS
jgi:hypothetical protein